MTMVSASVLDLARAYVAAGIAVVPVRRDGSKAAAVAWKPYHERLPTDAELRGWFGARDPLGLALVGGAVSGGLEQLDFDHRASEIFPAWSLLVEEQCPGLVARLSVARTPSGGYHVRYRCPDDDIPGNTDLAINPAATGHERILIQTRGEGGYALAPGCPAECHETRRLYEKHSGPTIPPSLTADEREILWTCARSFTCDVKEPPRMVGQDLRPGDDFDRRGPDWSEILEPHGWHCVYGSPGGERRWRRPGKERGWSATTGKCRGQDGAELLRVFSSNADPFQDGMSYGRFRAFALLNHNGNLSEAADDLARQGYGHRATNRVTDKVSCGQSQANGHAANGHDKSNDKPPPATPQIIRLSTVKREPVTWLMPGWIPEGTLTILDGDPGMAKSTLTLDLAARVSRGWAMPPHAGGERICEPGGALLLSAEDSLQKTVSWRLDAAGADSERVYYLDCMVDGKGERDPVLPYDLLQLSAWIKSHGVRLVVIDPLAAFIGQEYDAHKDQDIRRCLRKLRDFAEQHNVSLLLLRHLNKLNGGASLYRGGGSIGITGAARASLIVGRAPSDDGTRILAMNKLNLGPFPRSLAYRVDPLPNGTSRIGWIGESDLKAHEILWHHTQQGGKPAHRPADQLEAAKTLLQDWLDCGEPAEVDDIRRAAVAEKISWETVKRAKRDMDVQAYKIGSSWYWKLVHE